MALAFDQRAFLDLSVPLENEFMQVRFDAGAVVFDGQHQPVALDVHVDIDALPAMMQRVFEQIAGDPPEFGLVLEHLNGCRPWSDIDENAVAVQEM